jgi:hypothetical protein
VEKALYFVVPGSKVGVPDRPRVLFAGSPSVLEVIGGKTGNGTSPMIGQAACGYLLPQLGLRIAGLGDVGRSLPQRPAKAHHRQSRQAKRQP